MLPSKIQQALQIQFDQILLIRIDIYFKVYFYHRQNIGYDVEATLRLRSVWIFDYGAGITSWASPQSLTADKIGLLLAKSKVKRCLGSRLLNFMDLANM